MRELIATLGLLLALASADAQPDRPTDDIFVKRENAPSGVATETHPTPAIVNSVTPCDPVFGLDFMVGMMTGIRAEGSVCHLFDGSLRVEGFYGALFTKFGSSESAGAGLRWQKRRVSEDGCRSVVFGPGCDVLFHLEEGHAIMIAPNVELAWNRSIRDSAGWILGINAGVGIGVNGKDTDGDNVAGKVTPIISGFAGFRY